MMDLILSCTFATAVPATPRVAEVAAMFGIGLDAAREFRVLDDVRLQIRKGDVVYITGQSGSGKSVLLRCIAEQLRRGTSCVLDLANIDVPQERALVDCFDAPLDETLRLLSIAGLNDAFLFLRRPSELSDGQQYRLRLALALATEMEVVLIDEFCSTLDRTTARIIAHQVRRFATATGRTFIVATAHSDLHDDLQPDVYIEKLFGPRVAVQVGTAHERMRCTAAADVQIAPAGREAWAALSEFHYRGHTLPPCSHIFAATAPSGARLDGGRRVVGVIVYGYPSLANALRNYATGGRYAGPRGRRHAARLLNREVRTISRVVVDPQYRGLGLAVRLVKETMPLVGTPYIEALATMARVNPFFERAGMTRYEAGPPAGAARLIAAFAHARVPREAAGSPTLLAERIAQLDRPRRALLWRELRAWCRRYEAAKTSKTPDLSDAHVLDTAARHLFGNPVYYLWRRP